MKPWTTKEEKHLRYYFGLIPSEKIAKDLNRTTNSIRLKASRLKLKSSLTHKGHDLSQLVEMIQFGMHPTEIARELNTSTKAVYNIIRDRLGGRLYTQLKLNAKRKGRMRPIYPREQK